MYTYHRAPFETFYNRLPFKSHNILYRALPDTLYSVEWKGDGENEERSKSVVFGWRCKKYTTKQASGWKGGKAFIDNLSKPQLDLLLNDLSNCGLIPAGKLAEAEVQSGINYRDLVTGEWVSVKDFVKSFSDKYNSKDLKASFGKQNLVGGSLMNPALQKRITAQLDDLAEEIEHHPQISRQKRLAIAFEIDKVSEELDKISSQTSRVGRLRRRADVIQRDPEDDFIDTFKTTGIKPGQPYDQSKPEIKNFDKGNNHSQVSQSLKTKTPVRQSARQRLTSSPIRRGRVTQRPVPQFSPATQLRRAARALDRVNPQLAEELRESAKNL